MSEPPRPPGDGNAGPPPDPTAPNPLGSDPTSGYQPPPPPYEPPPTSGAAGYPPPPGPGGYPPSPGAPPPYGSDKAPGYGTPQGGYATSDDRTWTLLTHFGGATAMFVSSGVLGWVPPLIALVAKGNQSPTVRAHAVAALNFQLLWSAIWLGIVVISSCLSVIIIGLLGFFLLPIPWLVGSICGMIAGVRAVNGEPYRYPAAPNWIK